jgi:hypothetical protein
MKATTESEYIDFLYDFKGLWETPSRCGLKIVQKNDKTIVIATELFNANPGTSITNACAKLVQSICNEKNISPDQLIFIEHTPDQKSKLSFYNETFFRVNLQWTGNEFAFPKWESISKEDVDKLIC